MLTTLLLFTSIFLINGEALVNRPFFTDVSTQAKQDYYKIVNNKTLTRTQQKQLVSKWGKENGRETATSNHVELQMKQLHDYRKNITIFLNYLIDMEKEIDAIYFDNEITGLQRDEKLKNLIMMPEARKILSFAATTVKKNRGIISNYSGSHTIQTTPTTIDFGGDQL